MRVSHPPAQGAAPTWEQLTLLPLCSTKRLLTPLPPYVDFSWAALNSGCTQAGIMLPPSPSPVGDTAHTASSSSRVHAASTASHVQRWWGRAPPAWWRPVGEPTPGIACLPPQSLQGGWAAAAAARARR